MKISDAEPTAKFARQEVANLLERHVCLTGKDFRTRRYALLEAFIDQFEKQLWLWEAQRDALLKQFVDEQQDALRQQEQKEYEDGRKEI